MAKTVSCRDVGMDCDFVARGETNEKILRQAAEHARTAHNMTEIPSEVVDKVRDAIHLRNLRAVVASKDADADPDPDPDIPILKEAKAEYAKLQ